MSKERHVTAVIGPITAVVTLLLVGCGAAAEAPAANDPRPVETATVTADPTASASPAVGAPATPSPRATSTNVRPQAVVIPAIGVRSGLAPLRLRASGVIERPKEYARAGWYVGGPVPGDVGPAVIAGHVDSEHGPAVFWRLRDLEIGDRIVVRRSDGRSVTFIVEDRERYPKNTFPTARVYGPTPGPALRLITCAGVYDRSVGYRDNIVVYASVVKRWLD